MTAPIVAPVTLKPTRARFSWQNVRRPRDFAAVFLATGFFSGLAPIAPGTFGTVAGIPLAWFSQSWPLEARVALWSLLFLTGIWAAREFDLLMQTQDNRRIVLDEVVGIGITAWTLPPDWQSWLVAFTLFRILDIWKPWPIRNVDRWSHRRAKGPYAAWWGGFGVMADDLLAGLVGLAGVLALQHLGILAAGASG